MEKFKLLAEKDSSSHFWMRVPKDWRRPKEEESYELFWNSQDKFGQLLPRPPAEKVPAFYQVDYYTHNADAKKSASAPSFLWRALVHLAWRCDRGVDPNFHWWKQELGSSPLRVLEIGCGNGAELKQIHSLGHSVEGVEPDPSAREVSQKAGIPVHVGTAEELPASVEKNTYDVVLMMHVLEHCLDPVKAISNTKKLLGPGGRLIVEVPNNACHGIQQFGATWHWLDVPRHLNFFTEKSLRQLMESEGLRVSQVEYRGYTRQFLQDWVQAQSQIAEALGLERQGWVSYFKYFLQTAGASAERKYDSVRLVGAVERS